MTARRFLIVALPCLLSAAVCFVLAAVLDQGWL
jgi:hypothetical protein